ncbi:elongation factor Ts [bacterium]|jgi:elongation factor Ts|nr:elongation factor Ts [bacterium]MBT3850593.1 elongation factor Ts [bacterium]|tara:strand:+ start:4461 stop:5075 length:615 start_codon:yes stop_codon:yes gene_type:complete
MGNQVLPEHVKDVRERTSAPLLDCKRALQEADGDVSKAIELLKIKGLSKVEKKSSRNTPEGQVFSYIHAGGKIGILVEVNCETDFVARNIEFQDFAKEVAMQIAASDPKFISKDDMPESFIEEERKILTAQAIESGKKPELVEKVVEGKLNKVLQESCLLNQVYIRDSKLKVEDLLNELVSKLGENVKISRFIRYQLGEALNNE